jgi:pimeloyl-ACP methyl ester carboxylesterase
MKLFSRQYPNPSSSTNPPLVILHGLFGLSDNWATLAKEFSQTRSVWVPDLRNHGLSPHDSEFTLSVLVQDIYDFIAEHQLQKVDLMGHSLGGKIAIQLTHNHPEVINRLVVADMGLRSMPLNPQHLKIFDLMKQCPLSQFGNFAELEKWFFQELQNQRMAWFVLKNIKNTKSGFQWKLNHEALEKAFQQPFDLLLDEEQQIQTPTLFLKAQNSNYITDQDEQLIQKHFFNAFMEVIEDAGHWLHADQPKAFLHLTKAFL